MPNNAGVNRVFLLGTVEKEPIREDINGERVMYFLLKTTEEIKKGESTHEHSEFHNIKMPLEITKNGVDFKPGDILYIQGKLQTRVVYEDNVKIYRCEILATSVEHVKVSSEHQYLV